MSDSKIQRAKKQCEKLKEMSDEYWEMFEDYHKMELELEEVKNEADNLGKNKCRFGGTLNDKYLDEMLVVNNNVKILLHPFFKEIKDLKEQLTNYHTMMTACDKSVGFDFGIQDREYNPELLDDLDHIPYHLKELTEENKRLKEQIDELGVLCENIDLNAFKTWREITGITED